MNIKIEFFNEKFIDAIGAGIYEVTLQNSNRNETLYIGESVFVLVRCATHLYELRKDESYFGFTPETIEDSNITLRFSLYKSEADATERKKEEKRYIKEKNPLLQSGISDRMKSVEDKIVALTDFLNC